ncbi:uncharacterized protein [Linepithema humile]|uniref:uncharacterized protein n=1 Tax=Linepithema humile TaxID=83485 RepID=UPI000623106B|nr:PREDICTED: zinc finger and SCAN domain-containing protein 23-like [Linepithema humile]
MDISENQTTIDDIPGRSLPQFSEYLKNPIRSSRMSSNIWAESKELQSVPNFISTNAALNAKIESEVKKSTPNFCEHFLKEFERTSNLIIPSFVKNNTVFGVESDSAPSSDNLLLLSRAELVFLNNSFGNEKEMREKLELLHKRKTAYKKFQIQPTTATTSSTQMTELLQQLQTSNLQQLVKHLEHIEQTKKDATQAETNELAQKHNILNIPYIFKKQLQSANDFINSDRITTNLSDLNVHIETEQENESNLQTVLKIEQQVQTDFPKAEKKSKFRAKLGEVKVSIDCNGVTHYYCPECSLEFPNKDDIEQHIQGHLLERKYQCKECGAMLKRKEHLDQHMRGHSDERPYKCHICLRAFKRNEHLTRHCVIHSGNKDFLCNICQKAFSRKDHLRKHEQTHSSNRKNKQKEEGSYYLDPKDALIFGKNVDPVAISNQEINCILKDKSLESFKPGTTFLQHLQNLQNNSNIFHTFTSMNEQVMKDADILQQAQSVNINDILTQNTKYIPQF